MVERIYRNNGSKSGFKDLVWLIHIKALMTNNGSTIAHSVALGWWCVRVQCRAAECPNCNKPVILPCRGETFSPSQSFYFDLSPANTGLVWHGDI